MRSIVSLAVVVRMLVCAVLLGALLIPHGLARAGIGAWASNGPSDGIRTVAVAPSNNQIIYATGNQGLWKSLDGGNNWSTVGNERLAPGAPLAISPADAATVYSTSLRSGGNIIKTTNSGLNWTVVRPNANATALAIDATRPNIIYAGLATGGTAEIIKSSDGGATWSSVYGPVNASPGIANVAGIVADPANPDFVYAGIQLYHDGIVLRSTDAGSHWTIVDNGNQVPLMVPTALTVTPAPSPSSTGSVYVAWGLMGNKALLRSDDGGTTWKNLTSTLPSGGGSIISLVAPGDAMTIVASIAGVNSQTQEPGDVYVSLDGGAAWIRPALSPAPVGELAWALTTRTLYLATAGGIWEFTVPETGFIFVVDPTFRDYYDTHDGMRILGSPLSSGGLKGGYFVQLFEKGRIEDHTGESADPNWQFMYGLLVDELQQVGANLPVGGDTSTVTYGIIQIEAAEMLRVAPPPGFRDGTQRLSDGSVFVPFTADLSPAPGHKVPDPFWDYINRADIFPGGWLHDIGLPITEPLPATVDKGKVTGRQITVQAFQRTILTYDPLNPPEWQAERANVGADYRTAFPSRVPNQAASE